MESAVTSQESDSEVQSEAGPGEEAGVEEIPGSSTQSVAVETVTAASAPQVPILTVSAPTKKEPKGQQSKPKTNCCTKPASS